MVTAIDILKAAREKLEGEGAWTKGAFARTKDGNVIGYEEKNAVCFCALGALRRVTDEDDPGSQRASFKATEKLIEALGGSSIPAMNDHLETTQLHMLMSFDFAILMAEDEVKV